MIIIAFSCKTSKLIPKILCRKYKHVAPIAVYKDKMVLYQFIRQNIVVKIHLRMSDISRLQMYGWKFIYLTGDIPDTFNTKKCKTCVQITKRAICIKNWKIQTPNSLYKYLQR
jgi:hypothetical protein